MRRFAIFAAAAMLFSLVHGPADAAGRVKHIHLTCAGYTITQPGKYSLNNSVHDCAGTAITILASNVSLNLNRRSIGGPGGVAGVSIGIAVGGGGTSPTDVRVTNGTLRSWSTGLIGGIRTTVARVTARASYLGFIAVAGDTIENSKAIDDTTGIFAFGDNVIFHNRIVRGERGIEFDGAGNRFEANRVQFPSGAGIVADFCPSPPCSASSNTITDNTVQGAGLDGIFIGDGFGTSNLISGNRSFQNGFDGIHVTTGNLVVGNVTDSNLGDGIEITSPDSSAFVSDNVADFNTYLGIRAGAGVAGSDNEATGNGDTNECDPAYLCS